MKFFTAKPHCLVKVGVMHWTRVVDCARCASSRVDTSARSISANAHLSNPKDAPHV